MKTPIKTLVVAVVIIGTTALGARAQDKAKVSVEIDPATFVFNGYGVHLRLQPKNSAHLLVGIGAYAMDFPDLLVDLNENNKDQGWQVRLNQGIGFFAEHHFNQVNKGWFVGGQAGVQTYKIEQDFIEGDAKYTNLLIMGHGGYSFKPFNNGLYIKPWAGIGYTRKISGENSLGGKEYDIAPVTMFATLHIGYTF